MKRLIVLMLLAACGPAENPRPAGQQPARPVSPLPAPPASAESRQQAVQVARQYFHMINGGRYDAARAMWSGGGSGSGLDRAAFARQFEPYAAYETVLDQPGEPEGAAGSVYIEIPTTVIATRRTGQVENFAGKVILRRSNVEPPSSEEHYWRIFSVQLTRQ